MTDTPRPQDTGCTTIEFQNEGVTNGVLSMVATYYKVDYDPLSDTYRVRDGFARR